MYSRMIIRLSLVRKNYKGAMVTKFSAWLNHRVPINAFFRHHLVAYIAPRNLNFWYFFGVFSLVVLVNQILTGIWLLMVYTPTAAQAFDSIEHLMRNVPYGWLLRYLHAVGASAFFIVVYLHIYRGIRYGSYKAPRELLWLSGCLLFLMLLAESFTGYVLPWGQMSYWATKVIMSLFGALPWIGKQVMIWLQGDYAVSGITLHRFFAFHVVVFPLFLLLFVGIHIICLHAVGSNNPDGIDINKHKDAQGKPLDGIPFHPYFTVKDTMGVAAFLILFLAVVFYLPTFFGQFLEADNFIPANPLLTPLHIRPVWYMAPFYAILRAIPDKSLGALAMLASLALLFFLPWLDRSKVRSFRYRGWMSQWALTLFVVSFLGLGYLGIESVTPLRTVWARIFSVIYFSFFLFMPWYTSKERTKPVPDRLTG
jgi:ubiquinol-cytochrome c reductase cytochrome b subunit